MSMLDIEQPYVVEVNIKDLKENFLFDKKLNKYFSFISFEKENKIITKKVFIDNIFNVFNENNNMIDTICSVSYIKEIRNIFFQKKEIIKILNGDIFHGSGYLIYYPFDKISLNHIFKNENESKINLNNQYLNLFN